MERSDPAGLIAPDPFSRDLASKPLVGTVWDPLAGRILAHGDLADERHDQPGLLGKRNGE